MANTILQEIRRSEFILNSYKENGSFHFTRKIIATNTWAKNIGYFVNDLEKDELDKISDLYSTGEYLDEIISKISSFKFDQMTAPLKGQWQENQIVNPTLITGGQQIPQENRVVVPVAVSPPWNELFNEIISKWQPIYHSSIGEKLRKIVGRK